VTAYRRGDEILKVYPGGTDDLSGIEPIVEEWPGWDSVDEVTMKPFMDLLEKETGIPVSILSTGKRRDEVCLFNPFTSEGELA